MLHQTIQPSAVPKKKRKSNNNNNMENSTFQGKEVHVNETPEMDLDEEIANPDWITDNMFDAELYEFLATAFPRAVKKGSETARN